MACKQGRLALGGPIGAVPFHVLECVMLGAAAQRSRRAEGRPSRVADRAINISYSSEPCWRPSAACTLKHTWRRSRLKHVRDVSRKMSQLQLEYQRIMSFFHFCEFFIRGGIHLRLSCHLLLLLHQSNAENL